VNQRDFVAVEAQARKGSLPSRRGRRRTQQGPGYCQRKYGRTDAGRPWYQDGAFVFLSNGKVKAEALRDISARAW